MSNQFLHEGTHSPRYLGLFLPHMVVALILLLASGCGNTAREQQDYIIENRDIQLKFQFVRHMPDSNLLPNICDAAISIKNISKKPVGVLFIIVSVLDVQDKKFGGNSEIQEELWVFVRNTELRPLKEEELDQSINSAIKKGLITGIWSVRQDLIEASLTKVGCIDSPNKIPFPQLSQANFELNIQWLE